MDTKKRIVWTIVFLFGFATSLLFLFLAFLCVYVTIQKFYNSDNENVPVSDTYKYLQFDPSSNETNVGFVRMANVMSEEFLSYRDDSGKYILISKFGNNVEYKCSGTCSCEKMFDKKRRIISSQALSISKALLYLVAAVSTFGAIELSRKYFDEACQQIMEENEDCPLSDVRAEVVGCLKVPDDLQLEETNSFAMDNQGNMWRRYECMGRCVDEQFQSREHVPDFICSKLELTQEIQLQIPHHLQASARESGYPEVLAYRSVATNVFMKNHLHGHCYFHSQKEIGGAMINMCRGYHEEGPDLNPYANCIERPWVK